MKEKKIVLGTAFLEGAAVLVVEIAGARALAPFFGATLKVWTAQITATLLFLALGYGLGGRLSKKAPDLALPAVFLSGGLWLAMFPLLRAAVLHVGVRQFGVAGGSFFSSCLLFGAPLLCLGAVSPLLIQRLDKAEPGAGSAAGSLFFTNTLGGLAGGWFTALVLIPLLSLRLSLGGCGLALMLLGAFWALRLKRLKSAAFAGPAAALFLLSLAPRPAHSIQGAPANKVVYSRQSGVGLVQVLEMGSDLRSLLIDGVTQGGMSIAGQNSFYEFTEYLNFLSYRYHSKAKSALLLGLGSGMLARQLTLRGLQVTVVEVEPRIEEVARRYFNLQKEVRVIHEDARALLERSPEAYDLIFLDAFAGETSPWHLVTEEAVSRMRSRLNPGGRLLVNLVTREGSGSPGLDRVESVLAKVFGEAYVYVEKREGMDPNELVNGALVAGEKLAEEDLMVPSMIHPRIVPKLRALVPQKRAAKNTAPLGRDDHSDLDYADAEIRAAWRFQVLESLGPEFLSD